MQLRPLGFRRRQHAAGSAHTFANRKRAALQERMRRGARRYKKLSLAGGHKSSRRGGRMQRSGMRYGRYAGPQEHACTAVHACGRMDRQTAAQVSARLQPRRGGILAVNFTMPRRGSATCGSSSRSSTTAHTHGAAYDSIASGRPGAAGGLRCECSMSSFCTSYGASLRLYARISRAACALSAARVSCRVRARDARGEGGDGMFGNVDQIPCTPVTCYKDTPWSKRGFRGATARLLAYRPVRTAAAASCEL
eukprot:51893-Chlamydomonas_euryale.AAC.1